MAKGHLGNHGQVTPSQRLSLLICETEMLKSHRQHRVTVRVKQVGALVLATLLAHSVNMPAVPTSSPRSPSGCRSHALHAMQGGGPHQGGVERPPIGGVLLLCWVGTSRPCTSSLAFRFPSILHTGGGDLFHKTW